MTERFDAARDLVRRAYDADQRVVTFDPAAALASLREHAAGLLPRETEATAEAKQPQRDAAIPASAPARSAATLANAADLLRALSAPVRIAIVLELLKSDRCVHELVDTIGVALPLISQHLRVLKAAGVVHAQRHDREMIYRLVSDHSARIVLDAVAQVTDETETLEPEPDRRPGANDDSPSTGSAHRTADQQVHAQEHTSGPPVR